MGRGHIPAWGLLSLPLLAGTTISQAEGGARVIGAQPSRYAAHSTALIPCRRSPVFQLSITESQQLVALGRMRSTEVLLLLVRKPSDQELRGEGALCSENPHLAKLGAGGL